MKLAMFAVLIYPLSVLGFSAASVLLQSPLAQLTMRAAWAVGDRLRLASANANKRLGFRRTETATRRGSIRPLGIVMLLVASPM